MGDVEGDVSEGVFLWSAATAVDNLLGPGLQLLEFTVVLDAGQVAAQQRIHVLKACDLLVPQTTCADADPQAKGTKPILSDAFM